MSIDDEIKSSVLSRLPFDASVRPDLDSKSAIEVLAIYFNWRGRFIAARPRRVHTSHTLLGDPLYSANNTDVKALIAKIEAGDDLTPHLSTRIRQGYETPQPGRLQRQRDLDLMLADWNVHHLHLSTKIRPDGFVERGDPVLFAAVTPDNAYAIGLFPHCAWTREEILNILIDEWPASGLVHMLPPEVVGLEHQSSENERAALRRAGIMTPLVERGGRVYHVGSAGMTSAGTSTASTVHADRVMRAVMHIVQSAAGDRLAIYSDLAANGISPPAALDLHFEFVSDDHCAIIERQTGAVFLLQ
jgi:hypothetical protein